MQVLASVLLIGLIVANLVHHRRTGDFLYPAWVGALILVLAVANLAGCTEPAPRTRDTSCNHLRAGQPVQLKGTQMEGVLHTVWESDGTAWVYIRDMGHKGGPVEVRCADLSPVPPRGVE